MTIAYRTRVSTWGTTQAYASIPFNIPAETQVGDLMIWVLSTDSGPSAASLPGWTKQFAVEGTGSVACQTVVWTKVADATDLGTQATVYASSSATGFHPSASLLIYSGAALKSAASARPTGYPTYSKPGAPATMAVPSVGTLDPGDLVVVIGTANSLGNACSTPIGFAAATPVTERAMAPVTTLNMHQAIGDVAAPGGWTVEAESGGSGKGIQVADMCGGTLVLTPAAAPPPPPATLGQTWPRGTRPAPSVGQLWPR